MVGEPLYLEHLTSLNRDTQAAKLRTFVNLISQKPIVHSYDCLTGVTKDVSFGPEIIEGENAKLFAKDTEQDSISIYGRNFYSESLCLKHFVNGSKFLIRLRRNASKEVEKLFKNKNHFVKVKLQEPKKETAFATNLPYSKRQKTYLIKPYALRWGVETSFKELSENLKVEQWHSKSINGCLQELYVSLIIFTLTRILMQTSSCKKTKIAFAKAYYKPNFKLLLNHFIDNLMDF